MQAKHVDIKRPGVIERLARIEEKARREAAETIFGVCSDCGNDVEIDENIHGEDHRPEDLLCGPCQEEAEKVTTRCRICGDAFRVYPYELDDGDIHCEDCEEMLEQQRIEDEDDYPFWVGAQGN